MSFYAGYSALFAELPDIIFSLAFEHRFFVAISGYEDEILIKFGRKIIVVESILAIKQRIFGVFIRHIVICG